MLSTNTNFDAKHALENKTPIYLIHFDGETTDYCNHAPGSPSNTVKKYLISMSGLSSRIIPEEGKASIGGSIVRMLDQDDEITALLATDANYFHRKKTTIKAGYLGMDESDMLTIQTGWITGLKMSLAGTAWDFTITDPQKFMQRKIFRGATDAAPVTISGNAINILLACLTSTGAGTNGDYDIYDSANGLGIDDDFLMVSEMETIRNTYYPGASHYMQFSIDQRIVAKEFFQNEIFKPLNLYPIIDGQGRFGIRRFTPPLATNQVVQSYDEENIIGLPGLDTNLKELVNEIDFFYDWDGGEYDTEVMYVDGTSINNRGPGKKVITIQSKGLKTSPSGSLNVDVSNIVARRKNTIFNRFLVPPIKLSFSTFFTQWLSEVGDIVPISHSKLPDIENGTRGLSAARMEIINKTPDFKAGKVKFEMMDTGFDKSQYFVISPSMTVVSGTSGTQFTVSVADAAKFANFTNPEVRVCDANMRTQAANVTLLTVNETTGVITCDDIGSTPAAGWIIIFADYDNCTVEQKLYGFMSDALDQLGTANDPAHLIVP